MGPIRRFRSDRGGEFTRADFDNFLNGQSGSLPHCTRHATAQWSSGITQPPSLERVHAVLHHGRLPQTLWGEVIHFALWLKNRTSTRILGDITPYQRLHCEKPNLAGLSESGHHV